MIKRKKKYIEEKSENLLDFIQVAINNSISIKVYI